MSRKSIKFQAPAPRAVRSAAQSEQPSHVNGAIAPGDAWVGQLSSDAADGVAARRAHTGGQQAPDASAASAEAALRIARVAPLWLGWYHCAGAMTELLRGFR
jgi:hypothetical protein